MLIADEPNIREVILFPMNQRAEDLMMDAPSQVEAKQLKELHIKLDLPKKTKHPKKQFQSTTSQYTKYG